MRIALDRSRYFLFFKDAFTAASIIARKIGIEKIRQKCPHFNDWLVQFENLAIDRTTS
ncbi:DUF4276 family protein [Pannus brasiliensis CCIBt3594]|uniref:DUF4276 family protein n=1 Tax=Pannus brasiliensis CCIBt3594 TaxID=1427578 RepID=A0AAW9QTL7_9CHRO